MADFTSGATTLTPLLIEGYRSTRDAGNLVHQIVASEWPAITLRPARPRTGRLRILCATLTEALAMEALHAGAAVVQLVDAEVPARNMTYVSSGEISVALDERTLTKCYVSVDFQEIQA